MLTSLPPELLEIIVQDCLSASSVESIAHVATLGATCRILRCAVDQVGAPVLREHSVASLEHLAVAIAIKGSAMTDGNTSVGFEFASVSIARENGAGSRVKGSRARVGVRWSTPRRMLLTAALTESGVDPRCGRLPRSPPFCVATGGRPSVRQRRANSAPYQPPVCSCRAFDTPEQ
jgi:hypothetical protein